MGAARWAAAEKVRRDKWMAETMSQVKAQTIKGLEPEIERLLAQHKQEKARLEENHRLAMRRAKDDMVEDHHRSLQVTLFSVTNTRQHPARGAVNMAVLRF